MAFYITEDYNPKYDKQTRKMVYTPKQKFARRKKYFRSCPHYRRTVILEKSAGMIKVQYYFSDGEKFREWQRKNPIHRWSPNPIVRFLRRFS